MITFTGSSRRCWSSISLLAILRNLRFRSKVNSSLDMTSIPRMMSAVISETNTRSLVILLPSMMATIWTIFFGAIGPPQWSLPNTGFSQFSCCCYSGSGCGHFQSRRSSISDSLFLFAALCQENIWRRFVHLPIQGFFFVLFGTRAWILEVSVVAWNSRAWVNASSKVFGYSKRSGRCNSGLDTPITKNSTDRRPAKLFGAEG